MFGGNSELEQHVRLAEKQLARLTALARDIAAATRCQEVARILARQACETLDARASIVVASPRGGASLELAASHGVPQDDLGPWADLSFDLDHPLVHACRSATPAWVDASVAARTAYPGLELVRHGPVTAFVALPLCAERRAFGAVGVSLRTHAIPEPGERELLATVVELCAQAYVRALRHDVERTERVAAARLGVMLEAGQAISSATHARDVIERLGELVVPRFADWTAIDLVTTGAAPRLAAITHVENGGVVCTHEDDRDGPLPPATAAHVLEDVLRTGEARLFERATPELVRETAPGETELAAARAHGVRSAMVVPLTARDSVLGAALLVSTREGIAYDEMDLRLASKVAHHAALALDNARLIEAERDARCEAQRANRMKDAFLATISHELRTPLHAILGWATLLRSGALEGVARDRAVETIERNARAQARLVDDVLDVSRIISGKLALDREEVELAEVLERAIDVVWPSARAKRLRLDVDVPPKLGRARGDRGRLEQVFWNVLSNAVKFTPEEGRVHVEARAEVGTLLVRITDSGKGIRREFLGLVFEPFHQQDSSTTRGYGGLGLGLSIAHHLVLLHGGAITVQSDGEGRGATFEIRLPSEPRADSDGAGSD
jgi:signal transduction histidine kinase